MILLFRRRSSACGPRAGGAWTLSCPTRDASRNDSTRNSPRCWMDRSFRDFFALSLRNRNLVPQLFFASIPCPAIASQDIRLNAYFIQFSIFNRTAKLAADKIIKLFNVDVVTHFLPMQVVLNRDTNCVWNHCLSSLGFNDWHVIYSCSGDDGVILGEIIVLYFCVFKLGVTNLFITILLVILIFK